MARGGNRGGGPRWSKMPRAKCPLCGLIRPVGVHQGERDFVCNNSVKCKERRKKRKAAKS